jgi:hypothetical protein
MMKVEPDQEEEVQQDMVKTAKREELRRFPEQKYEYGELYVTVEEEE